MNEEWISDKARYACDGLKRQRLDTPYIRKGGKLVPASWTEAFAVIAAKLENTKPEKIAAIVGDLAAAEEIKALKDFMQSAWRDSISIAVRTARKSAGPRAQGYLFNTTIAGIEAADALLLIGTNPRWEAPVLECAHPQDVASERIEDRQYRCGLRSHLSSAAIGPGRERARSHRLRLARLCAKC